MAVNLGQLAVELRLSTDPASPPDEPLASVLSRALRVAEATVNDRVNPATPEDLRDIGTIAVAAYVFNRPSVAPGTRFANAWANSGAEAMLSRWVSRRALPVGGADNDPTEDGNMLVIDALLSLLEPISETGRVDRDRAATLQVIPQGKFEAAIEGTFLQDGEPIEWIRILPLDRELIRVDQRLFLSPHVVYRARLVSGGPVRILLG